MAGTFIPGEARWVDLSSSDIDRSVEFYRVLFDWEATASGPEYGGYVTFRAGGETVAGLASKQQGDASPEAWTTYLTAPDALSTGRAIADAGGTLLFEPMEIPGMGVMGMAMDPTGALFGTWQSTGHAGFEAQGRPRTVSWVELHTRDVPAAVDFYGSVFGLHTRILSDSEEFRYSTIVDGEREIGGIFDASGMLAADVPSNWQVYFGVTDTDHAVGRVLELGGRVVEAPADSPYGRLAAVTDPLGAYFKLISVG